MSLEVSILAPREVDGGDTVPMMAVTFRRDRKATVRKEMVEIARDLITKSCQIGELDSATVTILGSIIGGNGLFEHNIGEFFLLYGKFEEKHQTQGTETKKKMNCLLNKDKRYYKKYKDRGTLTEQPLPYAVRNILAHKGHNKNKLDKDGVELKTSIELLRKWTES